MTDVDQIVIKITGHLNARYWIARVYNKRIEFCAQCDEFPCETLHEWVGDLKHHAKAVERLKEMRQEGIEEWLSKNEYS